MVGSEDICEKSVVKELGFEEKNNLFVIFPIGTIMQDGGKRKEVIGKVLPIGLRSSRRGLMFFVNLEK